MHYDDYKVTKVDERTIKNGKKMKLAIVEKDSGDVVFDQWVGYSKRQLTDGRLGERIVEWGHKKLDEMAASDEDEDDIDEVEL